VNFSDQWIHLPSPPLSRVTWTCSRIQCLFRKNFWEIFIKQYFLHILLNTGQQIVN
jgi:hypothetical protein